MSDAPVQLKDNVANSPPIEPSSSDANEAGHDVPEEPSGQGLAAEKHEEVAVPPTEEKSEGEGASGNDRASGEDQGEQQPAQTELQSSSAGAQANPIPPASSVTQSLEKPTNNGSSTRVLKSAPSNSATSREKNSKKKPSFFSKLFKALVPCVGSSKSNEVDPDNASAAPLREKQRDDEKKEKAQEASTTSIGHGHSAEASTLTASHTMAPPPIVVPSQHVAAAPSAATDNNDTIVIVPPSPTKRLPTDETGGLTSGAVQPPGSTGTEDHDGDDHTEHSGSSFTEEEAHDEIMSPNIGGTLQEDDFEDEEERLIMNGGAGIPIGPVCGFLYFLSVLSYIM